MQSRSENAFWDEKAGQVETAPAEDLVTVREGFRWDDCDAYLFDIDGTLLHAHGGVHTGAFSRSVEAVMGHPLSIDSVPVHGSTDTGILRDAFRHAAIPEEIWQPRLEEILQQMRERVLEQRAHMSVTVLPGVLSMLAYLKRRGKLLGVATGNLEQIGWLKIEIAGLRDWFTFGGFSDRHAVRSEMIAQALAAGQFAGTGARVCVVGDTPSDIAAAKANSLPTIAVATGVYSYQALLEHQPEVCTTTLEALLGTVSRP
jgi:phosphoglycolate phosphatase-like HAD superfamily hydrolase